MASREDEGFSEIQLNGKQAFFLFMAATSVLVVSFMLGMLVGRGVRAEREEAARSDALTAPPPTPVERNASPTPAGSDPRTAAPPAPAETGESASKAAAEEPPVAAPRNGNPSESKPSGVTGRVPQPVSKLTPPRAAVSAAPEPQKPQAAATTSVAPSKPPAPPSPPPTPAQPSQADPSERSGYAVQVAAVNDRAEADAIARRLGGKGYKVYVESPRGGASMYRVRVGTFETRREAQSMADKLKSEEKFNPWVTR